MARRDYYVVLGVSRNASPDEVRKAFRALALQFHPDRNPGDAEADRRFREIAEAWDVLGDPEKRARYDRLGPLYTDSGRPPRPEDLADALREAFGGFFRRKGPSFFPEDLRYTLTITLEEAASGCEKMIDVQRTLRCKTCDASGDHPEGRVVCAACGGSGRSAVRRLLRSDCATCNGKGYKPSRRCERCGGEGKHPNQESLKVKVPAGVATGQKLKLKGRGHEGAEGVGDLFVLMNIADHPLFRRRGADLLCEVPITFAEAALGGDMRVPTLDGSTVIRIPPGTSTGKSFRLPGRGLPVINSRGKGDLHIKVIVEVPPTLDAEQRAALKAFADRTGIGAHPRKKEWLDVMQARK